MPESTNPVVDSYRQWAESQGIRDRRDDTTITREIGDRLREQGRLDDLNRQHPEFREQYLDARREDAPGVLTEFGRGLQRGVQQGGVAIGAARELGWRALGNEDRAERAREFQDRRVEALQDIAPPSIESHRDIRTVGDTFRWLSGHAGQSAPVMGAMAATSAVGALGGTVAGGPVGMVTGGLGTAIGTRVIAQQAMRRMVQRGVERTVARAASAQVARGAGSYMQQKALRGALTRGGALAGGFLPMEVSYVGDFYSNAMEQGAEHDVAARNALLFGTPAALVETVYPARVGALLMRKLAREGGEQAAKKIWRDRVKGVLREAGLGAAMEGSAEAMGEAFMIAGEMATIPGYEITPEQIRSRLEHAFAAGGALGVVFGGAAGAMPSRTQAGTRADAKENALDEVLDQVLETTEQPAVEAEWGRQVAEDIEGRSASERTAAEQEYIDWWEENLTRLEQEAQSPEALTRLNQLLAVDEIIGEQDARLEGRRDLTFDIPTLEPGAPVDPFALPAAEPSADPMLIEGPPPADPSQIVVGSPIDARRETVSYGQIDPDVRAALEDATSVGNDPFAMPDTAPPVAAESVATTEAVETQTQPSEVATTTPQPHEVATEAGVPSLLGITAEAATEGTPETLLATNLIPFDPTDTQAVTRAALTEGQTASQTRNFIVVQNADGTVEVRGVFRQGGQQLAHNKASRVSQADIAREVRGADTRNVNQALKLWREEGKIFGSRPHVRERSQAIIDAAERLGYDPNTRAYVSLAAVSGREGAQVLGYFQTNQVPPQLFQRFASRAEFDATMDAALRRAWGESTLLDETWRRKRVPGDPLAEARAEVEQLSQMTPEQQRQVADFQRRAERSVSPQSIGGQRTVAIDDSAVVGGDQGLRRRRGTISTDIASARKTSRAEEGDAHSETGSGDDAPVGSRGMVAEDSGPDVGDIYSQLIRSGTSTQLIDNLGGVSGILDMMRGTPEQVRTRLQNEVAKLLPEGQRRQWMGEGIPDDVREAFTDLQNRQLDGLASDLQGMAEKGIFYRKQRVDEHRLSNEELRQRFSNVSYTLARLGVTLDIRSPDTNAADSFWHGEGGRYIPSNRTVELSIEDILNPTYRNLRDLMHELAHDVFQSEPQHIQEMLQDMIARMDPNDLSFYGEVRADPRARLDDPAGLGRRVVTEEMLVEHLTWQGLDAETARGLVRRLVDAVKEMLLKAALEFQRAFTLSEPVSDWLAREYIETRWQRMLGGRPIPNAETLLGRLGGRKLTYSESAHFFTLTTPDGFTETVNPFTGEITPTMVLADSPEALDHNRNAIIAAEQTQALHERDAEMEVAEVLLRREMEDAGIIPSPEQDRAYMEAVERGDTATAQRMVDEAAKAAGYDVEAYHAGTVDNVFREEFAGSGITGVASGHTFFSSSRNAAAYYEDDGSPVRRFWLRGPWREFEGGVPRLNADQEVMDAYNEDRTPRGTVTRRVVDGFAESDIYTLPFSEDGRIEGEAKLADPVTYDDNGNVIPLSQRFNPASPDIRYRQEGDGKTRAQIVAEARAENQRRRLRQNALVSIAENNEVSKFIDRTLERMRTEDPKLTREELLIRMGVAHDPRSLAQRKADSMAAMGDPVSADTTLDSLSVEARAQAEMKAVAQVNRIQRDLSQRTGELTRSIQANTDQLAAKRISFEEVAANVADMKAVERQIRQAVFESIEETRKAIKAQSLGDEAAGNTVGVLRTLLNLRDDQAIPANYERVLNNLVTNETPIFSYIQRLRRFSEDGLDFASHTVREIRQEIINARNRGDDSLADLVRGERGTALLATLISFVKNESHLAAAMEVQRMDATVRQAVVKDIQRILKLNTEQELAQLRERVRAMPRSVQNNLIVSYVNKRRELIALERRLEGDQNRLAAVEQGAKEVKLLADELGARHNVHIETPLVDGEELVVPAKPDATTASIEAGGEGNPNWATLRVGGDTPTSNAQKIRWVERMKRFIEYRDSLNDPAAKDLVYRTVKVNAERLGRQVLQDAVYPYRKGWLDQMRHSFVQQLRKSGLPAARMAASMLERREAIVKPNEARSIIHGNRWEGLESRLLKQARVSQEFFMQNIWNPAAHWLGLEAMAGRESALADLRSFLFADPMVRDALGREGAWQTFVELLERTDATNKWFTEEVLVKHGLAIRDDSLGTWFNPVTKRQEYLARSLVKGGTMVIPRSLSNAARVAINEMARLGWWRTDADRAAFIRQLRENPEEAQVQLAQMVTPTIRANFIEPLIHNDAGTILDRPTGEDGVRVKADPALIAEAWGESNGDLIAFGRRLYELHTGEADPDAATEYAGTILNTIGKYHKRMAEEYVGDISDETGTAVSTDRISYASINARTAYDLPSQFFTYERFGKDDNRFRLQQVASQAVFGRDFQELFSLFGRMEDDLRLRKNALDSKTGDLIRENPRLDGDRKALERELKKAFGKDWELYRDLDDALRVFNARRLTEQVKAMFGNHNGMTNDFRTFQHVINFVVGQLVNNPKTGLKNMTSNNDIMRVFGVNKVTMRSSASSWAETVRQGWATLASLVGKNVLENREKWMQIDAAGYGLDYAGELNLGDLASQRGPMGQWDRQGVGGKIKKALAITSDLMNNTTINPAGAEQRAVLFRPFAPFQMSQLGSNRTAVWGMMVAYETYARKIAEFYRKNSHRLNDPDYEVTARDIGETKAHDRSVFEKMSEQAKLHGFTMEDIGRAAFENPNKSRFPFDVDLVQKIAQIAISHVSMESNLTNRPVGSLTSQLGRMSIPLVGWSIESFNTTTNMMRDSTNARTLASSAIGLAGLMAVVVPVAVLYSFAFDEYDRRLLGKQPNIRPMNPSAVVNNPQEAVMGLIERVNAMGPFGIGGEALAGVAMIRDSTGQKVLSVDERVVWVNTLGRLIDAIGTVNAQGITNTTYASIWRQLFQSTMGSGPMQAMQMTNTMLGHPPIPGLRAESGVTQRINVQNWLRSTGRNLGMEVRTGGGFARPTRVTPHVTNMQLAAFRDDPEAFQRAYRRAIEEARKMGRDDPMDHVKRSYQSRHPLRNVFRSAPSATEYRRLLEAMPRIGREATQEAIASYNRYGQRLGLTPYTGSSGSGSRRSSGGFASSFSATDYGSALRDAFRVDW